MGFLKHSDCALICQIWYHIDLMLHMLCMYQTNSEILQDRD